MSYEITGFLKMAEKDNWENGCAIEGGYSTWIDYPIKAETLDELKRKVLEFVGSEADAMELDACEEPGRIDVQKTENSDGYAPTTEELSSWKAGRIDLWAATYTCQVGQVCRKSVSLLGA